MRRSTIIIGSLIALGILGAIGWYLAGPLFYDRTVDEAFPISSPEELAAMSDTEKQAQEAEIMETAAAMPNKTMADPMPETSTEPAILQQGHFQGADDFHQGAGQAAIYELTDGSHLLRFEDFSVTNGPDLHVLLASHPDPASQADVQQNYIDLGSLKGNIGNQNYEIPTGTDVSEYKSVVIYCMPFHVIFATAMLEIDE